MRLRKLLTVIGVASLVIVSNGCSATTEMKSVEETEFTGEVDSSIVKINSCKFKLDDSFLGEYYDSCDIYLDKVTNTCYAKFHSLYHGIIIELLDNDNTPKSYSEDNKNELVLIEQGNFLVFEDIDTGVQYVVACNYSDYTVRRNETGELYKQ